MAYIIPYAKHAITPEDEAAVLRALRSGYLTQGPEVEALEHEWADVVGAKYAVACSSGTAALWLAYHTAFAPQAKPRIAPVTFVATAAAWTGGCRTLDCDRETGLAAEADVGVSLGGQWNPEWAPAILDACHGPYRHLGELWTVWSLHPAKHVAAGEGGMLATDDADLATQAKKLRNHGQRIFADGSRIVEHRGLNWRLPELNAALARSQLTRLSANLDARQLIAAQYDEAFAGKVQTVPHRPDSARHLYQIFAPNQSGRDIWQSKLKSAGIGTAVHYPLWMTQPAFAYLGYRHGMLPGAEWHSARTLSIPLFTTMTEREIETVIQGVLSWA